MSVDEIAGGDGARGGFGDRPVFVFSTPPTPNGDLHLGHLSGPYLGADAYVRFQRMNGAEAYHLTATDDYHSYVAGTARRDGTTPEDVAAHHAAAIRETLRLMDIEPDEYTTPHTDPLYAPGARRFFAAVSANGTVAPRSDPALFDAVSGAYLYEFDVSGSCPGCGEATGGNICEQCGEPNVCADLGEPRSTRSEAPPRRGVLERLSLPVHAFAADLDEHHRRGRVPARLRELVGRVLRRPRVDLAITHPADWGVAHPSGPSGQKIWPLPQMCYSFLHQVAALGRRTGRGWDADRPDPSWKLVHFTGYDNGFYYGALYPVLYRLAFPGWYPDIDYHVNEFYELDASKFSTSRGHAIWGRDVLGPHSVDPLRFHLSRTRPEQERTSFTWPDYTATVTEALIGTWQRWLQDLGRRVAAHHGGRAPEPGDATPEHLAFEARLRTRRAALTASLGPAGFSLRDAAEELHGLVVDTVRFSGREAFVSADPRWDAENRTTIALELAAARLLARCAAPLMPRFSGRLAAALGEPDPGRWPADVAPPGPGTPIALAGLVLFTAPAPAPGTAALDPAPILPATRSAS